MMKTKKKTTNFEKMPQNKPRSIRTSDDKQFKVLDTILMKYSNFFKMMMEDESKNQQQSISLSHVDSESFEIINQFMQLHKDKQVSKIQLPLKSNQSLKQVLEQGDAILVQKVMSKGDGFLLKILQATSFLQIEDLKKRLIAGLAIKLMKSTVNQLKSQYDLQDFDVEDTQIRQQVQKRLKIIHEFKEDQ